MFSPTSDRCRNVSPGLEWNKKKKNNLKDEPWQAYGQEMRKREAWLSSVWDMFLCGWLCLCTRHQEGDQSDRNVRGENEKARRASGILAKLEKCVLFETKHFRGKVRRRQVNRAVIHLLCWQWDVVCQGGNSFCTEKYLKALGCCWFMFKAAIHVASSISDSSDEFKLQHVCLRTRVSFTVTVERNLG